jgi:addiction module RelE/StbE family toxin
LKLRWLAAANEDRVAIYDYIEEDSPDNAIIVDDRILRAVANLVDFPCIGRPGRRKGTKELVIPQTSFLAAYRVRGDTVDILRIVRAAKRWPKSMPHL